MSPNIQNFDRTQLVAKHHTEVLDMPNRSRALGGEESQARLEIPRGARGRTRSSSDQSRAEGVHSLQLGFGHWCPQPTNSTPDLRLGAVELAFWFDCDLHWVLFRSKSLVPANRGSLQIITVRAFRSKLGFRRQSRTTSNSFVTPVANTPCDGLHFHHQRIETSRTRSSAPRASKLSPLTVEESCQIRFLNPRRRCHVSRHASDSPNE